MRKQFLLGGITILLTTGVLFTSISASHNQDAKQILLQANVEALSNHETTTSWNCDASTKTKCSASCPSCGTLISGTGRLSGSHSCS